jgi:hypothetical protein
VNRRSTGNPTKAERARMDAIKEGPCLCCRMRGLPSFCPEIHHLLSGNKRRGHRFTIGTCAWHHRGVVPAGLTRARMQETHGPSLAHGSKPFHAAFGSDDELLALQDRLLAIPEAA